MGFSIHSITMPDNAGPVIQDRLHVASVLNVPFAAAGNSVGTLGAVTAGSGYTFTPTLTITGGTIQAASAAGVAPVVAAGWAAVLRATMKVVGTPSVSVAGTGYVTNDTVLLPNGVEVTVTASAGAVTALALTTAGLVSAPGPLPATGAQISTSGVGVGLVAGLSWGIAAALVDDSGNYSVVPTGITVTSVDGNGTSGAVAGPAVFTAAGKPVFRQVAVGGPAAPFIGGVGSTNPLLANPGMLVCVQSKIHGFMNFRIEPTIAANSVTAGTLDALVWA